MLKDNFYTLIGTSTDTNGCYVCKVRWNASHEIYQAHFPGNPITPGACIVQITKELAEILRGQSLMIREIKNLKFINIIVPHEYPEVDFQLILSLNEENMSLQAKIVVFSGEMIFAKLILIFSIINC